MGWERETFAAAAAAEFILLLMNDAHNIIKLTWI